jgi:hypothetical protein
LVECRRSVGLAVQTDRTSLLKTVALIATIDSIQLWVLEFERRRQRRQRQAQTAEELRHSFDCHFVKLFSLLSSTIQSGESKMLSITFDKFVKDLLRFFNLSFLFFFFFIKRERERERESVVIVSNCRLKTSSNYAPMNRLKVDQTLSKASFLVRSFTFLISIGSIQFKSTGNLLLLVPPLFFQASCYVSIQLFLIR